LYSLKARFGAAPANRAIRRNRMQIGRPGFRERNDSLCAMFLRTAVLNGILRQRRQPQIHPNTPNKSHRMLPAPLLRNHFEGTGVVAFTLKKHFFSAFSLSY
jgi:hypothetical protein